MSRPIFETPISIPIAILFGPEDNLKTVDSIGLFDTKIYISGIYSRHSRDKTSSFKQYLFLKYIRIVNIANILVEVIETCSLPLCYFHLL